MNTKVLLLSCNTGQGHNSAAAAIAERLDAEGVVCTVRDALAFASQGISDFVSNFHRRSAVYAPSLFEKGNREAERQTDSSRDSICYVANSLYAGKLLDFITDGGYDAVVATHVFPSEALSYLRREKRLPLPCYFVATDYNCTPFVAETCLDGYFIPHRELADVFRVHGLDGARLIPSGIPVAERFSHSLGRKAARDAVGLREDRKTALVMTGSMGAGSSGEIVSALAGLASDVDIAVFGGSNERLKKELRERFGPNPRVRVLDYADNVDVWFDAADALVTKPGGLSITEAACKGIPLVLSTPLPGWESDNVDFFVSRGMALTGGTPEAQAAAVAAVLSDGALAGELVSAQRRNIPRDAAETVCRTVLEDIKAIRSGAQGG